MVEVTEDGRGGWRATRDGEVVGRLLVLLRPDRRRFLVVDGARDAYRALVDRAVREFDTQEVYTEVDEDAGDARRFLADQGFVVNRREHLYLVPTDPSRLTRWTMPDGVEVVSAADSDVDRLRELDDLLRQDVPGTDGWRNDPPEFVRQTFEDPQFDPDTYLIAVEKRSGAYVGLVRVWIRPDEPRLGLIATVPEYRRRGVAGALLARAFGVVHGRGLLQAACEVDEANAASNALMARLGARRVGGGVELVRR